ncbi:MAG: adenosine kinase [Acidimicrobiales bacterium]
MSANAVSGVLEVVTVGHAIVDVLAFTDDSTVEALRVTKGTMTLVDGVESVRIYAGLGPGTEVSGGSAANTAVGLAELGVGAGFIGKVRDDTLGQVFAHDIRASGVAFDVPPASAGPGTGRCLVMVTPDAEKTMCTHLGIGAELSPDDVDTGRVGAADVVYIEGYLCGVEATAATVDRVIEAARAGGSRVALSLSDPFWVQIHGGALDALLDRVDVLFANADEACGLVGTEDLDVAIKALAGRCETVTVTCGAEGARVAQGGAVMSVPAAPAARVVDTTGAGDMYAAGFLCGLVRGLSPEDSARLGGIVAAEVVSHLGARPQVPLVDLVAATGLSVPARRG